MALVLIFYRRFIYLKAGLYYKFCNISGNDVLSNGGSNVRNNLHFLEKL